jgi:mannose/fructose/N-acetylgalactosamine-specific phosphotransferase system component IID
MDFDQIMQTVTTIAIAFGLKIVGAIVVWMVVIRESFGAAGFPVPEQHLAIRNQAGNGANA